jgi:ZIP Zinc transporter
VSISLPCSLEQLSSQSGAQDIPSQSRSAGGRNSSSFRRAPQSSTRWQYEALSASGDADAPYADVDDESKAPKSKRANNNFVRLRRQKSVSIDGVGESDATPAGQLHRHRSHASRGSEAKGQGRDGSKRHSAGEESISSGECGSLLDESFDSSAVPGAPTLKTKTRPSYGGVGGGEEGEHGAGIGQPETFPADENGTHAPQNHSAARPQATALQQGPRIPGHASSATMLGHSRRLPSIFLRPSQDEEREDDTEGLLPAHRYSFHPQVSGFRTALASIFGLLIHAVADGIAMGASIASSNPGLRWIIFAAIMIHKAPASFGLCSVLLSRGLLKRDIAKALLIFSLCTPLGAVLSE